ncbi:MAG TPA: hypothetical protein VK636_06210 [Gemmatimonadaceae bacterium]|nr:hypothetical protein [Gemmatimonadaceae bacterium]
MTSGHFIRRRMRVALIACAVVACNDTSGPNHATAPTALDVVAGDRQTATVGGPVPQAIVLRIRDALQRNVSGSKVTFVVTAGNGQLEASSRVSDDSGLVRMQWTLGTSAGDDQMVTAKVADATGLTAVIHATARADVAKGLRVSNAFSSSVRVGDALGQQPAVAIVDRFGNATTQADDVTVTASLAPSVAHRTLNGTTSAVTNASGVAIFTNLSVVGDSGTALLSFAGAKLTSVSAPLAITPGPAVRLDPVGGLSIVAPAGDPGPAVRVRVVDSYGNGLRGDTVIFNWLIAGLTVRAVSDASGLATLAQWTLPKYVDSFSLIASLKGAPDAQFTVRTRPGPVAHLSPIAGTTLAGNAADDGDTLTIRATDAQNNGVSGVAVTFGFVGATPLGVVTTDSAGFATFTTWKLPSLPATYQLIASATGVDALAYDVTVSVGPPSRLAPINFPISAAIQTTTELVARVTDAGGNMIPKVRVQWSPTSPGITFGLGISVGDDSGIVRTTLTTTTIAGISHFRANFAEGGVRDFNFNVLPGPFAILEPLVFNVTTRAGSSFSGTVRAYDLWRNPVPGVAITARTPALGSNLTPLTPAVLTTDAFGRGTFSGIAGPTAGLQIFYFDAPGGITGTFQVQVTPP